VGTYYSKEAAVSAYEQALKTWLQEKEGKA
jgi:hypothetical protein